MKPEKGLMCLRTIKWGFDGKLYSPIQGSFTWREGGIEEMEPCHEGHRVPTEGCSCGLYATFDLDVLSSYMETSYHIVTLCITHGDGLLHTLGLKAQQLEVVAVVWYTRNDGEHTYRKNVFNNHQLATLAAAQYFNVPVVPMATAMQTVCIQYEAWVKWNKEEQEQQEQINKFFGIGGK